MIMVILKSILKSSLMTRKRENFWKKYILSDWLIQSTLSDKINRAFSSESFSTVSKFQNIHSPINYQNTHKNMSRMIIFLEYLFNSICYHWIIRSYRFQYLYWIERDTVQKFSNDITLLSWRFNDKQFSLLIIEGSNDVWTMSLYVCFHLDS